MIRSPDVTGLLASTLTLLSFFAFAGRANAQETIRQYQLEPSGNELRLVMKEVPRPTPGAQEVLLRCGKSRDQNQNGQPGWVFRLLRGGAPTNASPVAEQAVSQSSH